MRAEIEAARHRRRFPHHRVAILETRVLHVFGENTEPLFSPDCDACKIGHVCVGCAKAVPHGVIGCTACDVPPF